MSPPALAPTRLSDEQLEAPLAIWLAFASGRDGHGEVDEAAPLEKWPRLRPQSRVVDAAPFSSRAFANRAPCGKHLDETGNRGEPRALVRPEGATGVRARLRR